MSGLQWGVKQSFRAYVEGSGGRIEAGGGAVRSPDGGFEFAPAPGNALSIGADGAVSGEGRYLGELRFEAHGGMLSVFLADPRIESGPDGLVLTVADSPARNRRIAIANLDTAQAPPETGGVSLPTRLTLDGMFLLGDHYPPGTLVDPVRLAAG